MENLNLPCFRCGKEVHVYGGRNNLYWPKNGKFYAQHTGGCNKEGSADTDKDWEFLASLSEDRRKASEVPEK